MLFRSQLVRVLALPEAAAHELLQQQRDRSPAPLLHPRQSFEGYTIVRELHASARSHLYLAVDERDGRQVALKTLSAELAAQPAAVDRFLLEDWVARRIDHPQVLRAWPDDRPRQHIFSVSELVTGQTLAQWMVDHPHPPLADVRALLDQLASALQAFHRKEMLHQDLRPENLMIDAHGTLRLIDFGSVHVAGLAEAGGLPGEALAGTLQYSAPEYFLGEAGSPASEVFAMAVLAYQMLTGALPYGLQVTQVQIGRAHV